jgi:hypothetical protein
MRRRRLVVPVLGLLCLCALLVPAIAAAEVAPLGGFGSYGEGAGQLQSPTGEEYAADGDLYVADYYNDRVDVFSASGGFLFAFGAKVDAADNNSDICTASSGCVAALRSSAAGGMNRPADLTLYEGKVFVADIDNHRVDVFSEEGEFEYAFGEKVNATDESNICTGASGCQVGVSSSAGEQSLIEPTGVVATNELIYVTDYEMDRVDAYEVNGVFEGAFGREVGTNGANLCFKVFGGCHVGRVSPESGAVWGPISISVAGEGLVAVGDEGNHRVDIFEASNGAFIRAMGEGVSEGGGDICYLGGCQTGGEGESAGALWEPAASAMDAEGDLFVADENNNRVSEFGPAGEFIEAFGSGVLDGTEAFQVCATVCQAGLPVRDAQGTAEPDGLAFAADGTLAVSVSNSSGGYAQIARFGGPSEPTSTGTGGGDQGGTSTAGGGTSTDTGAKPTPVATSSKVVGKATLRKLKLDPKKGTATLAVTVDGAGKLVVSGTGLKKVTKSVSKAGKVTVTLKLTGAAAKKLAKAGKAKVKVTATFTPTAGTAGSATKSLLLKEKVG